MYYSLPRVSLWSLYFKKFYLIAVMWESQGPYYSVACMVGLSEPAGAVPLFTIFLFSFWPLQLVCGSSVCCTGFSEVFYGHSTSYFYACAQPCMQICQWLFICWMRFASVWGHPSREFKWVMWTLEMGVTRSLFMPLFSSDMLPHLPRLVLWPFLVAVCRWTGCSPTVTWTKILWSMLPFRLW